MPNAKHKLGQKFSVEGYWWLPGPQPTKVAGTFSHDPQGETILETMGLLDGSQFPTTTDSSAIPRVLGVTKLGEPCTLLGSMPFGDSFNLKSGFGLTVSRLFVPHAIFGGHIKSPRDDSFVGCALHLEGLEEWVGRSSLSFSMPKNVPLAKRTLTLQHTPIEKLKASLSSIGARLYINFELTFSPPSFKGCQWTSRTALQIMPRRRMPLAWFLQQIWDVQAVVTLLSGSMRDLTKISFLRRERHKVDGKTKYFDRELDVITSPALPESDRPVQIPVILIPMYKIGIDGFANVLEAWSLKKQHLAPLLGLFLHSAYGHGMSLSSKLLFYTQTLESLHRKTTGGEYLPEAQYATLLQGLIRAIPAGTPNDLTERLKGTLKYGNELSLRTRLRRLLRGLAPESQGVLLGKLTVDQFVAEIVDTRNYYTHYSSVSPNVLCGNRLLDRVRRLRQLVAMAFLLEIGVGEALVRESLASLPGRAF